ncbi:MAG: hypothetical protein NDJ24_04695 [Alphaproteobacteria bacterium]|nr:hypothetical protein [Alphaproteobacteria bacterium]
MIGKKQTSTISAHQVHSILKSFNYEMVPATPDRELKKIAKATARKFPGVEVSASGDSVYFRFNGEAGKGPSAPFFVQADGMLKEPVLKGIEKITGIKFADHIHR